MEHVSPALLIQLTASALTIAGSWFYGSKSVAGPWLGLASQVPWNIIMIQGSLWGLLPVDILMAVMHTRALLKWRADDNREAAERGATTAAQSLQRDHQER